MKVLIFDDSLEKFIKNLQKPIIAKVLRSIDLLEKFGPKLHAPHVKKIKGNLFELRIIGEQEVRIFYTFYASKIFLLHGFIKKSRKTLKKEIKLAIQKFKYLTAL